PHYMAVISNKIIAVHLPGDQNQQDDPQPHNSLERLAALTVDHLRCNKTHHQRHDQGHRRRSQGKKHVRHENPQIGFIIREHFSHIVLHHAPSFPLISHITGYCSCSDASDRKRLTPAGTVSIIVHIFEEKSSVSVCPKLCYYKVSR